MSNKLNTDIDIGICIDDWKNYINNKKQYIIDQIDNSNNLDNSSENSKFIEILKSIINCKIFNVTTFSFLAINLLVNALFIDSEIIKTIIKDNNSLCIDIYSSSIQETNLKNIINIIIDFVVHIEISLNYHCILIIHFLNKVKSIPDEKPDVFNIFNKIDNDISQSIKSSTIILLFLKFVRKISGCNHNDSRNNILDNIIKFIKNNTNNTCNANNIKRVSTLNLKTKMYLDTFMININNYFMKSKEKGNNVYNNNIYSICTEYIISIVELLYSEFANLFDILEVCIIENYKYKKIDFTEEKNKELDIIRVQIKKLIFDEINKCKEIFK